jgi:demethylmenaquinone methyltransferase/2-methoxy-6-polyprenyl-1,4-benzoquinol methylase
MLPFSPRTSVTLRRLYTCLRPIYDGVVPWLSSRARTKGRDWLNVTDEEHVLDVGCGTGLALRPIAATNPNGWTEGLDLTPAMVDHTRDRMKTSPHDQYRVRVGNAASLPYPDRTFDAVFSSYMLDVLPSSLIPRCLKEMHRVLRPTGRLVLVHLTPSRHPAARLWTWSAHLFPPLLGGARPLSLRTPLLDAGFVPKQRETCTQLGLRSAVVYATPA